MTLKEQLEKYKKEIYHIDRQPAAIFSDNDRDDIMRAIGFQDAVDLLFPYIEALEISISTRDSIFYTDALKELREKLK